jgi:hypothetical protein
MLSGIGGGAQTIRLTLYTDAYVIHGDIVTRQRRVSDILNEPDSDFLVLANVVTDEFGSRSGTSRADFAQVNLGAVLFAVADTVVEAVPELRTPKVPETAMISIPPFRVTGRIHLLPERALNDALNELYGRFIPVTKATFWSDVVGEARQSVELVAVHHARAQILAPYREIDLWAGLPDEAGGSATGGGPATGDEGDVDAPGLGD